MKPHTDNPIARPRVSLRPGFGNFFVAATILMLLISTRSNAGIVAEWLMNPVDGNWNDNLNWSPRVPNGPSDGAFFEASSITDVSITANTEVAAIVFASGASAFGITASGLQLTISGDGITNNSGQPQNFVTVAGGLDGIIVFTNSATAGSGTFTNTGGSASSAGVTAFVDSSTAGNGTFTNNGGTFSFAKGGRTEFAGSATAGSGTFTNNGGINGANSGSAEFFDTSTAGSGTFTNNGSIASGANGGFTQFTDTSTAGSAILIANGGLSGGGGGLVFFENDSLGGTSRVEVFGNGTGDSTNGNVDISFHNTPGMAIGSIEGSGAVFLGANKLTVGGNKLSTTFSGVMQDGGLSGGTGGTLTKTGKGKLSLTNANTYTGGTTIKAGSLLVKNKTGSATGTGAVQVNAGTLEGVGKINGAVTIGTGSSSGAILLGGNSASSPGTLTINNTLTFNSLSTYKCVLDRTKFKASKVSALGVTINSSVTFTFVDTGSGTLATGTVFTVINNTSANPIFGTFSNLPDGSTFTSNGTNFKVRYTGGTGNDLTLKVVP